MDALPTARLVLMWLSVYPPDDTVSNAMRKIHFIFTLIVIAMQVVVFSVGLAFMLRYLMSDLEHSLFAFSVSLAHLAMIYVIIVAFLLRTEIPTIFGMLQDIYDANKNEEDSFTILMEANDKSEYAWRIYFKYVVGGFVVNTLFTSVQSVIVCYMDKGEFDRDLVFVPYSFILPWNQSTPIGYFGEILFSTFAAGGSYFALNGVILLLFISMCLHHQHFFKVLEQSLNKLNRPDVSRNNRKFVYNIFQFHSTVRGWFAHTAEIYSLFVMIELIYSMLLLSCAIFQLDMELKDLDSDFMIFVSAAIIGTSNLFLYCYFGKQANYSFEKMADVFYDCNWQSLPYDLQKTFIVAMANSQVQIHYSGFGVAILNLETFTSFMKYVYSYYMMFKTIHDV